MQWLRQGKNRRLADICKTHHAHGEGNDVPGNQTDQEGDAVSLQLNASDPDEDPLTFGATGQFSIDVSVDHEILSRIPLRVLLYKRGNPKASE